KWTFSSSWMPPLLRVRATPGPRRWDSNLHAARDPRMYRPVAAAPVRSGTARCPSWFYLLTRTPELLDVGGGVWLAPEEALDERALVVAAAAREHGGAPFVGERAVREALGLEARQHVGRQRQRPLISVIAGVVADEVHERGL